MNKFGAFSLTVSLITLVGCANPPIVKIAPNTYQLEREDHAGVFGSKSGLKAGVLNDMEQFAEKKGLVAIPISAREHPMGMMGDWASFEVTFKLVATNSPEIETATAIWSRPGASGAGEWRNFGSKDIIYPAMDISTNGGKSGTATNP